MKMMKKFLIPVFAAITAFSLLAGCGQQAAPSESQTSSAPPSSISQSQSDSSPSSSSQTENQQPTAETSGSEASNNEVSSSGASNSETSSLPAPSETPSSEDTLAPEESEDGKTLVVYFSASGNTKAVAETIAASADAELYEIVPAEPYTDADLNWTISDSRVNMEHNDPAYRAEFSGSKDLSGYDTIFIGYPLWWREAPSIVWNFIETSDLDGKTIIPFCTSTSDGIEGSVETLKGMVPGADWLEGQRFGENLNESAVTQWVAGLELNG